MNNRMVQVYTEKFCYPIGQKIPRFTDPDISPPHSQTSTVGPCVSPIESSLELHTFVLVSSSLTSALLPPFLPEDPMS
jgi:hypothetical protein